MARPLARLGLLLSLTTLACTGGAALPDLPVPDAGSTAPKHPNILVIIADDLGVDKMRSYGHAKKTAPPTPTLDGLAAEGVSFDRAWAMPVCSPTRATLLTGRHAFRTGIGLGIQPHQDDFALAYDEQTLPELLDAFSGDAYRAGAFGKWHLGLRSRDEEQDPHRHGFDVFAGSMGNLKGAHTIEGGKQSFFEWEKVENGKRRHVSNYATTETTDDALAFIHDTDGPWLAWVAYNAPHAPYHAPPKSLHTQGRPDSVTERYDAMVEAMDTEIGRLLDGLGDAREHTWVVFVGDNGTPSEAVVPPMQPKRAKHSVYEGGVKVPLIVSGPGVAHGRSNALVVTTDLAATLADLLGAADHKAVRKATDSISFAPALRDPGARTERRFAYAERFSPNGYGPYTLHDRTIRDGRFKLIRERDGTEMLFDLGDDWLEGRDLLKGEPGPKAKKAHRRLAAKLDKLTR